MPFKLKEMVFLILFSRLLFFMEIILMVAWTSLILLIMLRFIRNTIYARHGYAFNSIDLQEHFLRFNWYNGIKNNV
jgi:hypothetical protein